MNPCLEVLRHLEEGHRQLSPSLATHVVSCPACQALVGAWPEVAAAGQAIRDVKAPRELVAKLVNLPRLPQSCEQVFENATAVLDGKASHEQRRALVEHLALCPECRATWDVMATVRQVGKETTAPKSLLSSLAAVPLPQFARHQRQRWSLAAAAVYILAGTVFLLMGNSDVTGRQAMDKFSEAFFYARAAVSNRVRWAQKEVKAWLSHTQEFALDSLSQVIDYWQQTLAPEKPEQKPKKLVHDGKEEGKT